MIRITQTNRNPLQEFERALLAMQAEPGSSSYSEALQYIVHNRNPMVQQVLHQTLEELYGPMPNVTGYSDTGEAYWNIDDIAGYLGISGGEVRALINEIHDECGETPGVMDTKRLHTVH